MSSVRADATFRTVRCVTLRIVSLQLVSVCCSTENKSDRTPAFLSGPLVPHLCGVSRSSDLVQHAVVLLVPDRPADAVWPENRGMFE